MISKKQFLIVFISLSLFIGNSEAGWKFWKKDKETTTTTTTPSSISVQSTATPIPNSVESQSTTVKGPTVRSTVNTGTAIIGAGNPGLAVGASTTGENVRNNARPNRPNPGTEVGQDIIAVPKPNRPGVGGNGQSYRDWAVDLTGAGEPTRNQPSRIPSQGPTTSRPHSEATRPTSPHASIADTRSTSIPGNTPTRPTQPVQSTQRTQPTQPTQSTQPTQRTQPTQPTNAGTRQGSIPQQPSAQSTGTASRPTSVQSHVISGSTAAPPAGINQNRPGTPSSPTLGKSWTEIAAGDSRPASPTGLPPRQTERTRIIDPRPTSPGAIGTGTIAATDSTKKVYSSNPTYSKGNTVTDEDLEKLSEALYIKETNNANRYITLNLQKQTTGSSPVDQAPQPLLTVNPEALQIPTVQRILSIFDNYQLDTHTNEYISPAQRQEESLLVDTFLSTNVMSTAMRFLADKGFVRQDYYEYKDLLRRIWFNLFSRGQGKIGSTGFEHVFMAETRQADSGTEVLGLHNWIYFNAEETKRHIDYLGYINKVDLENKGSIVKVHARFNGYDKPVTALFVGTSPELEMALYTICFYARPDGKCPVSLGGTKFNIVTYKFKYRGKDLIGTAYPEI